VRGPRHIANDEVETLPPEEVAEIVDEALRALGRGDMRNLPREERVGTPDDPDYFRIELSAEWRDPAGGATWWCRRVIEESGARDASGRRALGHRTAQIELAKGRRVMATLDADAITNLRAGAAAALGARYLMPERPVVLAVIGTGRIAREVVLIAPAVLPVDTIRVMSRQAAHREAFVDDVAPILPVWLESYATVEECVAGADVVVAAVPSEQPILRMADVSGAAHVSLIAGDPRVVLADRALWETRACVPDESTQVERTGDVLRAKHEGWADRIRWATIDGRRATIADAALGRLDHLRGEQTMAVFTGMAALDLAMAHHMWDTTR